MKITLNLAHPSTVRERYGLAVALPTAILGAVVLAWLGVVAVGNFRVYHRVRQSVREVQQDEARMRAQETSLRQGLDRPELHEIYRQTGFINGAINRRQFSPTELVAKVAKLLPGEARLDGLTLSHSGKIPVVRLLVAGNNEKTIEKFLVNLEDSPDFAEVTILSQSLGKEGEEAEPPTLACTARYVGGPSE